MVEVGRKMGAVRKEMVEGEKSRIEVVVFL